MGLRYVGDQIPGIRREKSGQEFCYRYPTGETAKDPEALRRIKSVAILPAWTNVWLRPDPAGHLQVTGRDARMQEAAFGV